MDCEVEKSLQRLITSIRDSETYKEYQRQLALVKERDGLKEKLDEFRTRNLAMQMGEHTTFEQLDNFEREYEDLREDPLVDEFLKAELALCRMMQNMNRIIVESINFE